MLSRHHKVDQYLESVLVQHLSMTVMKKFLLQHIKDDNSSVESDQDNEERSSFKIAASRSLVEIIITANKTQIA